MDLDAPDSRLCLVDGSEPWPGGSGLGDVHRSRKICSGRSWSLRRVSEAEQRDSERERVVCATIGC